MLQYYFWVVLETELHQRIRGIILGNKIFVEESSINLNPLPFPLRGVLEEELKLHF